MGNADEDCPDCIYGAEFIDDGIPHRYITKMCDACTESATKAIKFLCDHRAGSLNGCKTDE